MARRFFLLLAFAALMCCIVAEEAVEGVKTDGVSDESCPESIGGEDGGEQTGVTTTGGGYKIPQNVLDQFLKLHRPTDPDWNTTHAVLHVTDGCPLNNMYRRFKVWIRDDARAFPNLLIQYDPGMDPVMQFQDGLDHPKEYLGVAREDVSEMQIAEVEAMLIKRGIDKDAKLAAQIAEERSAREAKDKAEKEAAEAEAARVKAAVEGEAKAEL